MPRCLLQALIMKSSTYKYTTLLCLKTHIWCINYQKLKRIEPKYTAVNNKYFDEGKYRKITVFWALRVELNDKSA